MRWQSCERANEAPGSPQARHACRRLLPPAADRPAAAPTSHQIPACTWLQCEGVTSVHRNKASAAPPPWLRHRRRLRAPARAGGRSRLGRGELLALPTPPLFLAGQHKDAQHRYERVLEHGVVVHDDGDAPHVRQEAAGGRAGQGRVAAVVVSAGGRAGGPAAACSWGPAPPRRRAPRLAARATAWPGLAPRPGTHPTTLPMMWPGLSHSWPLGYRLRSSPQLLSPCRVESGGKVGWGGWQSGARVPAWAASALALPPRTRPIATHRPRTPPTAPHLSQDICVAGVGGALMHLDDAVNNGDVAPVGVEHDCGGRGWGRAAAWWAGARARKPAAPAPAAAHCSRRAAGPPYGCCGHPAGRRPPCQATH